MTAQTAPRKLPAYAIAEKDGLFTLMRDNEAMKTPRNLELAVPYKAVAEVLLDECRAQQQERLDLRTMPMTQMVLTVLDVTTAKRGEIIDNIVRFGESELVCQRAEDPAELVAAQNAGWQPYLDWIKAQHGVTLITGTGIAPFKQDEKALAALRVVIEGMNDYAVTGLSEAVGVSGSLVLGLALVSGHASAAQVLDAAELDQLWQIKKWGADEEAEARLAAIRADLELVERWMGLIK